MPVSQTALAEFSPETWQTRRGPQSLFCDPSRTLEERALSRDRGQGNANSVTNQLSFAVFVFRSISSLLGVRSFFHR
jgi:hypothetical protein